MATVSVTTVTMTTVTMTTVSVTTVTMTTVAQLFEPIYYLRQHVLVYEILGNHPRIVVLVTTQL